MEPTNHWLLFYTPQRMIRTILVLTFLSLVYCDDSLELLLDSYQNPSHKLESGLCCDSSSATVCHLDPCDTTLTLCLTPLVSHSTEVIAQYWKAEDYRKFVCPTGWSTVNLGLVSINSDNVSFPEENGWINRHRGIRNPVTLAGNQWKEGFKLLVVVSDFDFVKRELVSVLASDWDPLAVSEEFSSPHLVKGVTRGDATLAVSARIKHRMRGGGPQKKLHKITPVPTEPPTMLPTVPDTLSSEQPTLEDSTPSLATPTTTPTTTQSIQGATTGSTATTRAIQGGTTTTQAMQGETTRAIQGGITTMQVIQGETTPAIQEATAIIIPLPIDAQAGFKSANKGQVESGDLVGSDRVAGGVVGGVLGTLILTVLVVLVAVLCVSCLKNKGREDQTMLTGRANSEVTALRTGPIDNPNYAEVTQVSNSNSGYNFSNSLYGALSQGMSHGTHIIPPPLLPRPEPAIDPQYSQITHDNFETTSLEDSGTYCHVPPECPLPKGYSVVSREHMEEEEGYSVVTRDNLTDGYSVVTREHLEEASDSEEELSHDQGTDKLLPSH